ncbi:MAG: esterase, partial [Anaerolineae bacterium]|nr:esterase [Anaerolineae bacterium]
MASIMSVLGPIPTSGLGMILPHEHLFTDLRGPGPWDYSGVDLDHVVRRLRPHLEEIKAQQVTALVEATPPCVGRYVRALQAVAEDADLPVVAATGAYRDPFIPPDMRALPQQALTEVMVREISEGMDDTAVRAGFIKLGASDEGLTPLEERALRAAAHASLQTGVAIASHTTVGAVALRQAEVLEEEGLNLRRFIWVHAHCEPDVELHVRLARRGVFVEYDAIGAPDRPDAFFIRLLRRMWDAHCGSRVLLSQDAGWYQPGDPEAPIRGYGYLAGVFLPALRLAGFDAAAIHTMVVD